MQPAKLVVMMAVFAILAASALADCDPASTPYFTHSITAQEAFEGIPFVFDANATDPGSLTVTYSIWKSGSDSLSITIDSSTGLVNFTPADEDSANNGAGGNVHIIGYDAYNNLGCFVDNRTSMIVRDKPDILNVTPSPEAGIPENSSSNFNVTVRDRNNVTLNFSWFVDEVFLGSYLNTSNFSYRPGFCDSGNHSLKVNVSNVYNLSANYSWNLIVTNVNRPPLANNSIANLTWAQDTNLTDNFSMRYTFYDLDADECTGSNKDNLSYSATNTVYVTVSVNSTSLNVSLFPQHYFTGIETAYLRAYDGYGYTNSNPVILNVTDVPDAPMLGSIGNQEVKLNKNLTITINATDGDIPFTSDSLNFTLNDYSRFSITKISSLSAVITAISDAAGTYTLNATVTDTHNLSSSSVFSVQFRLNALPVLQETELTANSSVQYNHQLNATDLDSDPLNFTWAIASGNISTFSMNPSGYLSFTPLDGDAGTHNISINVSDGENTTRGYLLVHIVTVNTPPNISVSNLVAYEQVPFNHTLNITDRDGDSFNVTYAFIGTSISNFNMSLAGFINFTPLTSDIGIYNLTITAEDNNSNIATETINFTIFWANSQPNATPLVGNTSVYENATLALMANVSDPDIAYWDSLSFTWLVDGVNQSAGLAATAYPGSVVALFNYTPGFCDAGVHNITLVAKDLFNSSTEVYWNITASNTNRLPVFGLKGHYTNADFTSGQHNSTNISGIWVSLARLNSTLYTDSGTFISGIIDVIDDNYPPNLTTLSWTADVPASTLLRFRTRTSMDNFTWSNWSAPVNSSGSPLGNLPGRYFQYMANLTTSNALSSPNFSNVELSYDISNISMGQSTQLIWVDLDNYFTDADYQECSGSNKDNLTFNVSGNTVLTVLVDNSTHRVTLAPNGNLLTESIMFTYYDSYNTTTSNNVTVSTFPESVGGTTTIYSNSGSSSSTTITQTKIKLKNVTVPVAMDLVVPKEITMYENDTFVAPITLRNNDNFTLRGIHLSAKSNNSNLQLSFTNSEFGELKKGSEWTSSLIVRSFKTEASYDIVVYATIDDPAYEDSAKIIVSSIEFGRENKTALNTKIAFTRDLVTSNPECLELGEQLDQAGKEVEKRNYARANEIIKQVIENCRYLVTGKPITEVAKSRTLLDRLNAIRRNKVFLVTLAGLALIILGGSAFIGVGALFERKVR